MQWTCCFQRMHQHFFSGLIWSIHHRNNKSNVYHNHALEKKNSSHLRVISQWSKPTNLRQQHRLINQPDINSDVRYTYTSKPQQSQMWQHFCYDREYLFRCQVLQTSNTQHFNSHITMSGPYSRPSSSSSIPQNLCRFQVNIKPYDIFFIFYLP